MNKKENPDFLKIFTLIHSKMNYSVDNIPSLKILLHLICSVLILQNDQFKWIDDYNHLTSDCLNFSIDCGFHFFSH